MEITEFVLTLYLKGRTDEDIEIFLANCDSCGIYTTLNEQELQLDFSGNADDLKNTLKLINNLNENMDV